MAQNAAIAGKRALKKEVNCTALRRLKQDFMMIMKDPVPFCEAAPLDTNILEWHYIVRGPEDSPYHKGVYHGKLVFAPEYPYKPPSIYMITPNGRFKINTRLCLSISDFHPDTWNPTWNVSTILTGLLSFMLENESTYGSIVTSERERQAFARNSLAFNLKDPIFCRVFPQVANELRSELSARKNAELECQRNEEARLRKNIPANSQSSISAINGGQPGASPNKGDGTEDGHPGESKLLSAITSRIWCIVMYVVFLLILTGFYYIARSMLTEDNENNAS